MDPLAVTSAVAICLKSYRNKNIVYTNVVQYLTYIAGSTSF